MRQILLFVSSGFYLNKNMLFYNTSEYGRNSHVLWIRVLSNFFFFFFYLKRPISYRILSTYKKKYFFISPMELVQRTWTNLLIKQYNVLTVTVLNEYVCKLFILKVKVFSRFHVCIFLIQSGSGVTFWRLKFLYLLDSKIWKISLFLYLYVCSSE